MPLSPRGLNVLIAIVSCVLTTAFWNNPLQQERDACGAGLELPSVPKEPAPTALPPTPPTPQVKEEEVPKRTFVYSVISAQKYHKSRVKPMLDTWGRHANIAFVASDAVDKSISPKILNFNLKGKSTLGVKAMMMLALMCKSDADYYVMVDDDTFIVQHNFEHVVSRQLDNPREKAWYAGARMVRDRQPDFIGGGGGIVFSKAAMDKFCPVAQEETHPCSWKHRQIHAGDLALSYCMYALKVPATHIPEIQLNTLEKSVAGSDPGDVGWCVGIKAFWKTPWFVCPPMPSACAFHYIEGRAFHAYYYWTYNFTHLAPPPNRLN